MSGYILAVDPGGMTGFAYTLLGEHWEPANVVADQMPAHAFCDWTYAQPAFIHTNTLFVCESFKITAATAKKTAQPDALETIGVLKFFARRSNAQFHLQDPGSAKTFVTDKQLRKIGLWKPGQDHARDAIRHLVLGICSFGVGQQREELLQSLA